MSQFINDRNRRFPPDHGLDIQLLKRTAFIFDLPEWNYLEIFDLLFSFKTTVSLDRRKHHVDTLVAKLVRILQHPIGLPDARRRTDI